MLKEAIIQGTNCLIEYCEIDFALDLIEAGLSSSNLDGRDVEEILQDIALDHYDYQERAIEIMVTNNIEVPLEIKTKQFINDIGTRLYRLLSLITTDDSANVAKTSIDGVICDVEAFIKEVRDKE